MLTRTTIPVFIALSLSLIYACQRQSQPTEQPQPKELKLVCWNVLYGFNHGSQRQAGAAWIANQNPDVVALQELNGLDQESLLQLARKWGHEHAVILKENGFPVGLTSRLPIQVIEKRVKGFHHGYLHCKTNGIHFFVVHFWPEKDHEAAIVLEKARPLIKQSEQVIVAGDFNTNSRKDSQFLESRSKVTCRYAVVDSMEKEGFVDLVNKHDKQALFSCPSPVTIPRWSANLEELKSKRQRIDFVFADQTLAGHSTHGTIMVSEEIEKISDHYPVVVSFKLPKNHVDD